MPEEKNSPGKRPGRIIQWEGDVPLPEIPNVNYGSLVMQIIETHEAKTALVDALAKKSCTYTELQELILKMKDALALAGVVQGDSVLLVSYNHFDMPPALIAIMLLGAACVPVNPGLTIGELTHVARISEAKWAVVNEKVAEKVKTAFNAIGPDALQQFWIMGGSSDSHLSVGDLTRVPPAKSTPQSDDFDANKTVALMPFSSGTTGLPKGVMLSHRNLTTTFIQAMFMRSLNPTFTINFYESTLVFLPMYHMYGYNMTMAALLSGGQLVFLTKFSPKAYFEAIQTYKITSSPIVPYIMKMLVETPIMEKYDLSSLLGFITASAPTPETTLHSLTQKCGKMTLQGYGLTETSGIGTSTGGISLTKANNVGQFGAFFQVKVIDVETGQLLGEGEEGEICLRGPSIMMGYANNPKATAETIDSEGWLHTGDLGYYDEENNVYITDRIKDLIKVKGYQVAPTELENVIQQLENVSEVAVVGVPNERLGEAPRAWIVPRPGATIDKKAVIKHVADNVVPYKQLAGGVEIVTSIPKNHIGKIMRRDLRKEFLSTSSKL